MLKSFLLFCFLGLTFASMAAAGEPQVTEKAVVVSADGSYALDNKTDKDDITILEDNDIVALSDQKLLDVYMDVVVELDALKTFHATSGFAPKEFKKYKAVLKYRLRLALEIQRRKLELPPMAY